MDLGATICRPRGARLRAPARCSPTARPSPRASRSAFPRPSAKTRPARPPRHRLLDRAQRLRLAGPPSGQGHARRNGGAARTGMGRRAQRRGPRASAGSRHVFTHFRLELRVVAAAEPDGEGWWQPLDRPRRSRPADALPPRRRIGPCHRGARLPPEPFFSGPGLDRADQVRVDPARLAELAGSEGARQLVWRDGLPAVGDDGRLEWQPASAPDLFLGIRTASRASPPPSSRMPMRGRRSTRSARLPTTKRRSSPRRSASPGGIRGIVSAPIAAHRPRSSAAAGRGAAPNAPPSISRASTRS